MAHARAENNFSDSASDCSVTNIPSNSIDSSTKKRKITGRMSDASKQIRVMSHILGDSCQCKHFKCFENITLVERESNIKVFNLLKNKDEQMKHLAALVSVVPIARRRPRQPEELAKLNENSYQYKVRLIRNGKLEEIRVCNKAFKSLHGVTNRTLQTLKKSLSTTGVAPVDMRGRHKNRPHKTSAETEEKVVTHIGSLKGRKSHYSLKDSKKIYLSEDLNIQKLHRMYSQKYPNHPVSYEKYRLLFNTKFNISFGYPRTDTCSSCDEFLAKKRSLEAQMTVSSSNKEELQAELKNATTLNQLHLKKANTFYDRKRQAKKKAMKNVEFAAIVMDYQKNLPLPNISTNDVYYKRQLSFYSFNIHVLSTREAIFYTYDQTIARKGSDEVVSFLNHFITKILPAEVKVLELFCDSCAGQNKNYLVFRYLHYITTIKKRFDSFKITFPARGHSYLECDKNMGLINQKAKCELPSDWNDVILNARKKPTPFSVVEVQQNLVYNWTDFLKPFYKLKCPFATRPISEVSASQQHTQTINVRTSFNGAWENYIIRNKKTLNNDSPQVLYNNLIPISKDKYGNLQDLKKFCGVAAQEYFSNLPNTDNANDEDLL